MSLLRHTEDFIGAHVSASDARIYAQSTWKIGGTSIISPVVVTPTVSGNPGQVQLLAGNTSGFVQWAALGASASAGSVFLDEVNSFEIVLRMSSVSSVRMLAGLGTNVNDSNFGSDGIFFELDTAADSTYHVVARASSSETSVDTGDALPTANFINVQFVKASASLWHTYSILAGTRKWLASLSSNVPSGVALTPGVRIETLTSSSKGVIVDLLDINLNTSR